jgi:hypothetical protein
MNITVFWHVVGSVFVTTLPQLLVWKNKLIMEKMEGGLEPEMKAKPSDFPVPPVGSLRTLISPICSPVVKLFLCCPSSRWFAQSLKVADSSKMMVSLHRTMWHHIPENRIPNFICCGNLKSQCKKESP